MNSYTILATIKAGEDCRAITFHDVKAERVEAAYDWALTACRQLGVKLAPAKRRYRVQPGIKGDYMVVDTKRSIAVAYKPTYDEAVADADKRDGLEG